MTLPAPVDNIRSDNLYKVSDPAFCDIIHQDEPVHVIAKRDYPFAHEAPVALRGLNKLFFVSNRLGDQDTADQRIQVRCISNSRWFGTRINAKCRCKYRDPPYGHAQNFRPEPELDNLVYAFHPSTGQIDVLADKFVKPNGIVFSPDYKTVYVTDTGDEDERTSPGAETIYAFDVVQQQEGDGSSSSSLPVLQNRRVFAVAEAKKPDGIKVDCEGNVYTGTTGGIEVFSPGGKQLGRICCGKTTNLAFVDNKLYGLCEDKIVAVKLKVSGAVLP